jgi:peptidoglycan/xylan/chitin deacetylase (PgdA/CDA1 family)
VAVSASLKRAVAWGLLRSGALSLHRSRFERRRAIILLYHRVNDERDPFFPASPVAQFTGQIEYLARRYRVEPLDAVVDWLDEGAAGAPRVAVTFDDGYADTHDIVLPTLERLGIPATLYLSTAPPETGEPLWTDRTRSLFKHTTAARLSLPTLGLELSLDSQPARLAALGRVMAVMKRLPPAGIALASSQLEEQLGRAEPRPRVLGWEEVRRMARGPISLGAHTHNHYLLATLSDDEVFTEVETSVRLIRERVGVDVTSLAYPNGERDDYDARSIEVLRRLGLRYATTCRHAFAGPGQPRFELARLHASEPFLALFAARMAGLSPELRRAMP